VKAIKILLALSILFTILAGCANIEKESIIVGSKDFPEQYILGNMLGLLIEANTDLEIIHKDNMASHVIFAAIGSGAVDVYIDYTGTIFGSYLNNSGQKSAEEVFDISARELRERYDLLLFEPLGFNNTFCLAVRRDTAEQYNLRTFSDLAEVSADFIFGGSAEIISRNDGLPNLKRLYDMSFKEERTLHDVLRYEAIANNEIQVTEAFSTDALLSEFDLVVLEDDKNFFPPYHAVIIIRKDILEKHPELAEVLDKLTGLITDNVMRGLNFRADVLGEDPRDVAESFLEEHNLIG